MVQMGEDRIQRQIKMEALSEGKITNGRQREIYMDNIEKTARENVTGITEFRKKKENISFKTITL